MRVDIDLWGSSIYDVRRNIGGVAVFRRRQCVGLFMILDDIVARVDGGDPGDENDGR